MATMGGETLKAHLGMVVVQLFNGGYYVITKVALNFWSQSISLLLL
uniref:Uncharacterized protein n=1 Tax=Medicago truncatula TaxID=3880 RepID=B7FIJ5_MEDTR|nr:unknown [Medicago truncatula]